MDVGSDAQRRAWADVLDPATRAEMRNTGVLMGYVPDKRCWNDSHLHQQSALPQSIDSQLIGSSALDLPTMQPYGPRGDRIQPRAPKHGLPHGVRAGQTMLD